MISYPGDMINGLRCCQVRVSDKQTAGGLSWQSKPALVCTTTHTTTSTFAGPMKSRRAEQKSCSLCFLCSCQLYHEDPASPWITTYSSPYSESKLVHKADGMKHDHSWASHQRPVSERPNLNCEFSDIPLRKNRKRLSLTENKTK